MTAELKRASGWWTHVQASNVVKGWRCWRSISTLGARRMTLSSHGRRVLPRLQPLVVLCTVDCTSTTCLSRSASILSIPPNAVAGANGIEAR